MDEKKAGVCISVVIKNEEGKVLLGKRPDKMQSQTELEEQGTWTLPSTFLKDGEEFEQAAARVVMQESSIRVDFSRVCCVNNDKTDKAHFATIGMATDRWVGCPEIKNKDKIEQWEWFNLEDTPFPIAIPSAKTLLCFKKGKFNYSI